MCPEVEKTSSQCSPGSACLVTPSQSLIESIQHGSVFHPLRHSNPPSVCMYTL